MSENILPKMIGGSYLTTVKPSLKTSIFKIESSNWATYYLGSSGKLPRSWAELGFVEAELANLSISITCIQFNDFDKLIKILDPLWNSFNQL